MSLPIVLIGERHWDHIPRKVVQDLVDPLHQCGYTHFCFESAEDEPRHELMAAITGSYRMVTEERKKIEKRLGVSKPHHLPLSDILQLLQPIEPDDAKRNELAQMVKSYKAIKTLHEIVSTTISKKLMLTPIDIPSKIRNAIQNEDIEEIQKHEVIRIQTMARHILAIHKESEGAIVLCGVLHMQNLIDEIQRQVPDQKIVASFPHSDTNYDDTSEDDIDVLEEEMPTLGQYAMCLASEDVSIYAKTLADQVLSQIPYVKTPPVECSHSQRLSECFQVQCTARIRPGYYVDALFDVTSMKRSEIEGQLAQYGIKTYRKKIDEKKFLVVPGINMTATAEKIAKLPV